MNVVIRREPFTPELLGEIMPLAQKCWNESTEAKGETCAFYGERDFAIEPDLEMFQELTNKGALLVIALRDGEELKGYLEGFSYRALHHRKILGGIGDSFYIEPEYRSYAAVMVECFERHMRELGVGIIGWPVTPDGAIHAVLKARGYVGDDVVMEKRLCA